MSNRVDLHVHSSCSDGKYPPAQVVSMAAACGVDVLALCDHDNIDGVLPARVAGEEHGVTLIAGVEFSCVWKDMERSYTDIHVLGYGFSPEDATLQGALREFQASRAVRNEQIVENVNKMLQRQGRAGLDYAAVHERSGGSIGRPHIALELIAQGYATDVEHAFKRYLVPCNVEKHFFPVQEAIDMLHAAGGVAVLAHPPYITSARAEMEALLDALTDMGLQGIEVYNNGATKADVDWYLAQTRSRGLIATGGSDFHGLEEGGAEFGRVRACGDIPRSCYTQLQALLQTQDKQR
ncbi:MAG: PHP domain-containing protein [Desulfuromonadaceae bacterium]|nr:PHP domain-containing protein [Desulfuromonadaceae bacterium]